MPSIFLKVRYHSSTFFLIFSGHEQLACCFHHESIIGRTKEPCSDVSCSVQQVRANLTGTIILSWLNSLNIYTPMSCIHLDPSRFVFIHGERPFSLIYLQTAIENSCRFRCVLNWFGDWSTGALYQVGKEFTSKIDLEKSNVSTRYSEEQRYGKKNISWNRH